MTTDLYANEVEDGWAETIAEAWEVLEPVRQVWRDQDRLVEFEDEYDRADS